MYNAFPIIIIFFIGFFQNLTGQEQNPGEILSGEIVTYEKVDSIIKEMASEIKEKDANHWVFFYKSRKLIVIYERDKNRINVVHAITRSSDVNKKEMKEILSANWYKTNDVRYSFHDGWLWSGFSHKINTLTESEFIDGIQQVFTLAKNYGTYYMSIDPVWEEEKQDNIFND